MNTDEENAQTAKHEELKRSSLAVPFVASMHSASHQADGEPAVVGVVGPHTGVLIFRLLYDFLKHLALQGSSVSR